MFKKLILSICIITIIILSLPLIVINFDKSFSKDFTVGHEDSVMVKLYRHDKDIVEEINLRKYLEGVLAAEIPAKFDIEAIKAQAVASRTYVVSRILSGNKIHNIADVCDSVHSQAYIGSSEYDIKFGDKKQEYIEKIRRAISETDGEVIYHDGNIIQNALYFAVSSGNTENSSEIFSFHEPYLIAVNSEFDKDAPKATGEYVFTEKELVNKINDTYKNANVSNFDDIEILNYTESGSIGKIRLGNEIIRGLDFRYLLNLNSSNLSIEKKGDNVIINVKGYGHGVGLSQWGAGKMAELGYTYDEILKHYYTGIEINKMSYF